jgi:selenide,water dikinase
VLFERLHRADVRVLERARVAQVTAQGVTLEGGARPVQADFVTGAAGARPHPWLARIGLEHVNGYPVVDDTLRAIGDKAIYLAGDCAHMGFAPRPKAGVYAVRQAPILAANLRADLIGAQRRRYKPQRDFLKLISLGGREAVADWHGFGPASAGLWRWKDKIDRAFMDKLDRLPAMPRPPAPKGAAKGVAARLGGQPQCGGCGAKLGPAPLRATLDGLRGSHRDDVERGAGDDAAVLRIGDKRQVISTDHLRALNLDPATHTQITAIHALGDIWAMGAQPQAALASVILPRMTETMQAATLREVMEAARQVFEAEGAQIVGGHSSEGAELTVGFTVTGLLAKAPIPKEIPHSGLTLVLTRALGSGTLLAAEMQAKARGADVLAALEAMGRSQSEPAALLAGQALAMTDVTGFGLAGHLWEMLQDQGLSAQLDLSALPMLPGVEALAADGLRASLYPANRAALAGVLEVGEDQRAALLCDPQTAGGLLAAVPPQSAASLVASLRKAGAPQAAIIGSVVESGPLGTTITLR